MFLASLVWSCEKEVEVKGKWIDSPMVGTMYFHVDWVWTSQITTNTSDFRRTKKRVEVKGILFC